MGRILGLFSMDEQARKEKILLCMPFSKLDFQVAISNFAGVVNDGSSEVFFLVPQAFFHMVRSIESCFLLPLLNIHIKRNGVPSKLFFKDYRDQQFFCGVDLNPCFNITSATIIKKLASNQRIGFKTLKSHRFFNIEIISKDIHSYYNKVKEILTNHTTKTLEEV
ncbi:MAG: hypothetical protein J7K33_09650 [Candidatus Marinimicrobia bacterium]|nr:hypothetical protein [Candidatus Neomarinimicrobiota bacterium]